MFRYIERVGTYMLMHQGCVCAHECASQRKPQLRSSGLFLPVEDWGAQRRLGWPASKPLHLPELQFKVLAPKLGD